MEFRNVFNENQKTKKKKNKKKKQKINEHFNFSTWMCYLD